MAVCNWYNVMRLGILFILFFGVALYCGVMIFLISTGHVDADHSIFDWLPSFYKIKFFITQNIYLLIGSGVGLIFAIGTYLMFVIAPRASSHAKSSNKGAKATSQMTQYQTQFRNRLGK